MVEETVYHHTMWTFRPYYKKEAYSHIKHSKKADKSQLYMESLSHRWCYIRNKGRLENTKRTNTLWAD